MSRAGQASAFVEEDELLDALESAADWIPVRRAVVCRDADRTPAAAGSGVDRARQERLVLLARLRAEQLMCVRLLKLLARCESLQGLADSEGEAAAVLDTRRRRELRQRDFEDALSEHLTLSQACLDAVARARESERATRLRLLPHGAEAG